MPWGNWKSREHVRETPQDPYDNWIATFGGDIFSGVDPDDPDSRDKLVPIEGVTGLFDPKAYLNGGGGEDISSEDLLAGVFQDSNLRPRIPVFANNQAFDPKSGQDWIVPPADPNVDEGTVIVGVIDRGIALGHRSTRLDDGSTRFLAAWQQIADRQNPEIGANARDVVSANLPFGLGFLAPDIQHALDASRLPGASPFTIDEDAFNRRVGHEDYRHLRGHRELGRRIAHGSHVLDTAGGVDPSRPEMGDNAEHFAQNVRLIAVNLPERAIVGLASQNLTLFVMLGILWTVFCADAAWEVRFGNTHGENDGPKSFPIVINLSFAKQAGSRDGDNDLSRFMRELNGLRIGQGKHPVHLVVPAGNDNLARGHAHGILSPNGTLEVPWQIQPEDQSANYCEVWWRGIHPDNEARGNTNLEISVTSPLGDESTFEAGQPGEILDLPGAARVYCQRRAPRNASDPAMMKYLICTRPTLLHDNGSDAAPAGPWQIKLRNSGEQDLFVSLDVQTDQAEQPESRAIRRAYFDDRDYQMFNEADGNPDSYNYPPKQAGSRFAAASDQRDLDNFRGGDPANSNPGPVRRHGSMNLLASSQSPGDVTGAVLIAGYRQSDGKPAPYSGTGLGFLPYGSESGAQSPDCAFVSDSGAAHFGYLSAGARDGSKVAMRGTSFAAAQATRFAAGLLLINRNLNFDLRATMNSMAVTEEARPNIVGFANPNKVGNGRLSISSWTNESRLSLT